MLVRDGSGRCDAHKVRLGQFGDSRRGSRHARGYGTAWDHKRKHVMARDAGLCQVCLGEGRVIAARDVDHKVNKAEWARRHGSLEGVDDDANLQAICRSCHTAKTRAESEAARGRVKV